ncbi:FAD-binding oxidoreductase [Bosea sp. (in: a-proteobacteria)]|uniref:FAD-binding oxidoreductase n=1 Tax=Bosea sp. (in: a-proteobacteria) TaxID=1871050 RepID=UPI002638829D|nr:FAD-binding oxidoreductase [Bosea sp. (in: a-proteobacteria)]MCO5090768.1 FAD-binding oxidoreductase [Bosea sp. (in: a-proteobacteria)]
MSAPLTGYRSWGGLQARGSTIVDARDWLDAPDRSPLPVLAYGNGRSYGDSCLNDGGTLIDMRGLDEVLAFDRETGLITCGAGLLIDRLLEVTVPAGWFPPVMPGTAFVTIGGALANDVHGKNHHGAGTFGRHVRAFELVRSDGRRLICAPDLDADLFAATIGGFGLTGLVTQVTLQLMPIASAEMAQQVLPFDDLAGFFALAAESDATHDYTVAWVDSLAEGRDLGRGVFFRANHAPASDEPPPRTGRSLPFPLKPPFPLINRATLRAFNWLYRASQPRDGAARRVPYRPFFHPLDRIRDWNRAYGPCGLRQFQCALPREGAADVVAQMLRQTLYAGEASFLTVLKLFGDKPSPGLMSFPMPGATLTLDFPNRGERTQRLLAHLDAITLAAGGRINPYKDARMSPESFTASFPRWREFACHVDPGFSSDFWRRVTVEK